MIEKALSFVVTAHEGQTRKGKIKIPYVVHPIEVMKTIAQWGIGNENILCAALLHDVLEDTFYESFELEERFGQQITNIVQELTCYDIEGESSKERRNRKASYLASFHNTTVEALIIKVADRLCNSWDYVKDGSHEYANTYFHKAGEVFTAFRKRTEEIQNLIGEKSYMRIERSIYRFKLRNKS